MFFLLEKIFSAESSNVHLECRFTTLPERFWHRTAFAHCAKTISNFISYFKKNSPPKNPFETWTAVLTAPSENFQQRAEQLPPIFRKCKRKFRENKFLLNNLYGQVECSFDNPFETFLRKSRKVLLGVRKRNEILFYCQKNSSPQKFPMDN